MIHFNVVHVLALAIVEFTFAISWKLQEFVKAVVAYQKKLNTPVQKPIKLNKEMENKRKIIVRSFSLAKNLYNAGRGTNSTKDSELEVGAEFLEVLTCTTRIITLYFSQIFHLFRIKTKLRYTFTIFCVLFSKLELSAVYDRNLYY